MLSRFLKRINSAIEWADPEFESAKAIIHTFLWFAAIGTCVLKATLVIAAISAISGLK